MESANVVFEHSFDKLTLEQITELRTMRLNLAENMLKDISATGATLKERGLAGDFSHEELRQELVARVSELRDRLKQPNLVYADELDFYIDLVDRELSC